MEKLNRFGEASSLSLANDNNVQVALFPAYLTNVVYYPYPFKLATELPSYRISSLSI